MIEIKIKSDIPTNEAENYQTSIISAIQMLRNKNKNPKEILESNTISKLMLLKNKGIISEIAYSSIQKAILNPNSPYKVVIEKKETEASLSKSILSFIKRIFNILK